MRIAATFIGLALILGGEIGLTPVSGKLIIWPQTMNDLLFIGTVIAFFIVSALYVRFCDRL